MATGLQNSWSTTPATNATADSTINAAEGQAPSTLNDALRSMMAGIAKWRKDKAGGLVTGGTSTAFTLTTNEGLTLADGVAVTCRMSATSGAAPTLNVDSTGAVAIQTVQGTAMPVGGLFSGGIYTFTYYASSAAWVVLGAPGQGTKYLGEVFDYTGASAPALSLFCYGQAISRSTYAALFAVISTTYGVGDGSTTFNVPDCRGRVVAGQDDMGGSSADRLTAQTAGVDGDTLGAVGGAETQTLSTAQIPSHTHTANVTDPGHNHSYTKNTGVSGGTTGSGSVNTGEGSGTTGSNTTGISVAIVAAGGGGAHNNVQPTIILNKCIYAGA